MQTRADTHLILVAFLTVFLAACGDLKPWPASPLYAFPDSDPELSQPPTVEEAMEAIEGRYAHYDVVAYEDVTTRQTMRTFIVSYGFTEFRIEDDRLLQVDSFCHAEQILNRTGAEAVFSDAATQAIQPRVQKVELTLEDGRWQIYRPASPTRLGVSGDPSQPLSRDPDGPNLRDPDGDGNPGVTVTLKVGNYLEGEIYIIRREIYRDYLELNPDGNLYGHVVDESEQFVIGASRRMFRRESSMVQLPEPGMSPIILVRIGQEVDSCDSLMERRDQLFPPEPRFQ